MGPIMTRNRSDPLRLTDERSLLVPTQKERAPFSSLVAALCRCGAAPLALDD